MGNWIFSAIFLTTFFLSAGEEKPGGKDKAPEVKALIRSWKKANRKLKPFQYKFTLISFDKVYEKQETNEGMVTGKRLHLWRVDYSDKGRTNTFLVTKKEVRQFDSGRKLEIVFDGPLDDRFFLAPDTLSDFLKDFLTGKIIMRMAQNAYWFYLDTPLEELEDLFNLTTSSDKHWAYLEIKPKKRNGDFNRMRVVLDKKKFWVRQVWVEQPNGNTLRMELEEPRALVEEITRDTLLKDLPKNWEKVKWQIEP